jgi:TonB-linked SusC/RagA family outer membrane protein
LLAQTGGITVKGQVTFNGEPLSGVTVLVQNANRYAMTDDGGNYAITAVDQNSVLIFSFIGYKTHTETAGRRNVIDVTLEEDISELDETVVIGYGTQKKSDVTGAISQVKAEDMLNRTITRPEQALQGKTAGVQVVQGSAAPGSSPNVRIRGISSNGSNEPLYVVDGRIASDIGGIDPNDIESMEVLKDAASAAIYGIAAGNGVVLITTKQGMAGKTSIIYDFQTTVQSISNIPKVLNAEQYIDYMTEAKYLSMDIIMQNWDFKTNTNWADATFENSMMMRHNLSFMGGNSASKYYLSLSYLNNDGFVAGDADTYERYTGTINGSYKIKPWLEVGTNNQIEYYKRRAVMENGGGMGGEYGSVLLATLQLDPLTPVTYAPKQMPAFMQNQINNGRRLLRNADGNYYSLSAFQDASDQVNPFIMRDNGFTNSKEFNINGMVFINFKPIKELTVTSRFAYRLSAMNTYGYSQPYYANATLARNFMSVNASASTPINYQWENFANFIKNFGKHNVNAMIGTSMRQNINFDVSGGISGSDTDLGFIKLDPRYAYFAYATPNGTRTLSGGEETKGAMYSIFGRVSYDYDNRYFFQASLRNDAADLSQMPPENRHGYFPAVSAGWTMSNEKFMESLRKTVSFFKLRASWGQNGSLGSAYNYLWRASIGSSGNYPFTNDFVYNTGAAPTTLGNTELGWEKSEQLDFGFDARFFKDRLTLSFDYFNKTTKDLIISGATVSTIAGNTASPLNAGSISNKGVEIELGWRDKTGDFTYQIRANFASMKNEVTYIHESLNRINGVGFSITKPGVTVFEKGYPAWYLRGYQFTGIDPDTGDPMFANIYTEDDAIYSKTGERTPVINDNDKTMIGNPIPDFTYGITLTAQYKGFVLTVFGTGSQGNDIFMCLTRGDRLQANILREFYDDRWTPSNPNASRPRAGAAGLTDYYYVSSDVIYDGSYFKIKQIQLGYTLPKVLLDKIAISNMRVYCSLDDFFTFTSYPGFDPETVGTGAGMGVDKGAYPNSKKVVFGVNITF